jgi:hypothetical protein
VAGETGPVGPAAGLEKWVIPCARMHAASFCRRERSALTCAAVYGSALGASFWQALSAACQPGPCSCARIRGVILYVYGLSHTPWPTTSDGSGQNGAPCERMHCEYAWYC